MHFFVQFPSELQLIVAQLHFPKLVKMVNLYLFVFAYFKIRASKFVLNQSRAVGTQFLRLILSVGFWNCFQCFQFKLVLLLSSFLMIENNNENETKRFHP